VARILCIIPSALVAVLSVSLSAATSPEDDGAVLAGYRRLYNGDLEGARQEFGRVLATRPGDLAARFGDLNVLQRRLRENRSEAVQFERALDGFIADAEARYGRAVSDSQALFYCRSATDGSTRAARRAGT
jgi:hypothetical protein